MGMPSVMQEEKSLVSPKMIQNHLPFLEGLRGLAALYVLIHHDWMDTWNWFHHQPQPRGYQQWLVGWLAYGHAAVTVFIAISGFCLMLPVMRNGERLKGVPTFFRRRAVRILPPYYAALVLGLVSVYAAHEHISQMGVLWHLLIVHNLTQHIFDLNGPLWSVATECQIYLLFPPLVWLARRYGISCVLVITAVTGYGLYARFGTWRGFERNPHYLFIFALGMFAAWIVSRADCPPMLRNSRFHSCLLGLAAVGVITCYSIWDPSSNIGITDFFSGLFAFGVLVLATLLPNSRLARFLSAKPLIRLGGFSYSIYLVHQPLQILTTHFLIEPLGLLYMRAFLVRLAIVPIILLAAYCFYLLVEKPLLSAAKAKVPESSGSRSTQVLGAPRTA